MFFLSSSSSNTLFKSYKNTEWRGFFLCEAFSFEVDSCCYCISTSFWQSEELFLLKGTMLCVIGLGIGSHGVIPATLLCKQKGWVQLWLEQIYLK